MTDAIISVRRHPQDWQTARYRFSDVQGLHWSSDSGGVGRTTAYPGLFGYVMCTGAIDGEVAHSCSHGPAPHRIKVCLPKVCNTEHWTEILAAAPPKPKTVKEKPGGKA